MKMRIFVCMTSRVRTSIRFFFLLSFIMTAFCGCEKDESFFIELFSVSGKVCTDAEDMSPVSEIELVLAAYSLDDLGRTSPLGTKSSLSSSDGSYQLTLKSGEDLSGCYFVLTLSDASENREVKYAQFEQTIYLNKNSPSYSPFTKTYEVKDNDFKLKTL